MRITPDVLHARVAETARTLGCPEDTRGLAAPGYVSGSLRLRRDATGYRVELLSNEFGGCWPVGEAMTAREADALLRGLRASVTVSTFLASLQEGDA